MFFSLSCQEKLKTACLSCSVITKSERKHKKSFHWVCSRPFLSCSFTEFTAHFPKCWSIFWTIFRTCVISFLCCKMGLVDSCCLMFQVLLSHISAHPSTWSTTVSRHANQTWTATWNPWSPCGADAPKAERLPSLSTPWAGSKVSSHHSDSSGTLNVLIVTLLNVCVSRLSAGFGFQLLVDMIRFFPVSHVVQLGHSGITQCPPLTPEFLRTAQGFQTHPPAQTALDEFTESQIPPRSYTHLIVQSEFQGVARQGTSWVQNMKWSGCVGINS